MMTLELLVGLLLVVALLAFILYPLIASRRERAALVMGSPDETLENLLFERESTLAAIKDLQFDHAMGKLSDTDFQELDARYRARAVEILQRLDALGVASDEQAESVEATLDRWIEQAVQAARSAARSEASPPSVSVSGRFCTQCGRAAGLDDRFCSACGAPLRLESPAPS
jgi:hypothetical protein